MRFKKYHLLKENFETIDKVLSNPDYKDREFHELISDFEANGGKIFTGKFGKVLVHPKWKYVIKLFTNDVCYLKFIRIAWKNQNMSGFPKMFDKPRRIIPGFKRNISDELMYVVRMEKLNPLQVTTAEFEKIRSRIYTSSLHYFILGMSSISEIPPWVIALTPQQRADYEQKAKEFLEQNKNMKPLFDAYNLLLSEDTGCHDDLTMHNIMVRDNGELVLTDPLWFDMLATPYAQHDAEMRLNSGEDFNEYDAPPPIRGGELYKRRRVKKKKPEPIIQPSPPSFEDNEIPF